MGRSQRRQAGRPRSIVVVADIRTQTAHCSTICSTIVIGLAGPGSRARSASPHADAKSNCGRLLRFSAARLQVPSQPFCPFSRSWTVTLHFFRSTLFNAVPTTLTVTLLRTQAGRRNGRARGTSIPSLPSLAGRRYRPPGRILPSLITPSRLATARSSRLAAQHVTQQSRERGGKDRGACEGAVRPDPGSWNGPQGVEPSRSCRSSGLLEAFGGPSKDTLRDWQQGKQGLD